MVIKPITDDSKYKFITLKNGLKTMIVENEKYKKMYLSLTVYAGSYHENPKFAGSAHFLEHLIFMGSEKYPNENHFNNFINDNGGDTNASTSNLETTYHMEIQPKNYKKLFDIFSNLLLNPLITQSAIDREIKAVHSEYVKNKKTDMWMFYYLYKSLVNKKHPLSKFTVGNINSLCIKNIRDELFDFFETYYVANNMGLCIVSDQKTSDIIKSLKYFEEIPPGKVPYLKYTKSLTPEISHKTYKTNLNSNYKELIIVWSLPSNLSEYKNNDYYIIGQLLTQHTKLSLYSYLHSIYYVTSIRSDVINEDYQELLFTLEIRLTDLGMSNLNEVYTLVYKYLDMILKRDISQLVKHYQGLLKEKFKWKNYNNGRNLAKYISSGINYFPPKYLLSQKNLIYDYNIKEIRIILENYFTRENSINFIKIPDPIKNPKTEKYYEAKYKQISNLRILDKKSKLFFTLPNLYPFKSFIVHEKSKYLEKFKNKNDILMWYKFTNEFKTPKCYINLALKIDYKSNIKNHIYSNLIEDLINFKLYDEYYSLIINNYNISLSFDSSNKSLDISLHGNNNRIIEVLEMVLQKISEIKITESDFKYILKRYMNIIKNIPKSSLFSKVNYYKKVLMGLTFPYDKILAQNGNIQFTEMKNIFEHFIKNYNYEMFVCGNITKEQLDSFSYISNRKPIKIRSQFNLITSDYNQKSDKKSCFINMIVNLNDAQVAAGILFVEIFNNSFFDILRTKKQLGYIVNLGMTQNSLKYSISFSVQSEKSSKIVVSSINDFINKIDVNKIKKLSTFKHNVKKEILKKPTSLEELVRKKSKLIFNDKEEDYYINLVNQIEKVTLKDLKNMVNHIKKNHNIIKFD